MSPISSKQSALSRLVVGLLRDEKLLLSTKRGEPALKVNSGFTNARETPSLDRNMLSLIG